MHMKSILGPTDKGTNTVLTIHSTFCVLMNLFHFWPIPIFDIAYLHCKGERERDKIERKKR